MSTRYYVFILRVLDKNYIELAYVKDLLHHPVAVNQWSKIFVQLTEGTITGVRFIVTD